MGKSTLLNLGAELSGGGGGRWIITAAPPPPERKAHSPSVQFSSIRIHGRERPHEWRRRVTYVPQNAASSAGLTGTPRELLEDVLSPEGARRRIRRRKVEGGMPPRPQRSPRGTCPSGDYRPSRRPLSPPPPAAGATRLRSGVVVGIVPPRSSLVRPVRRERVAGPPRPGIGVPPGRILLDEPTSGLDEISKRTVEGTLARLASSNGGDGDDRGGWNCAVVMVTHDEEQAQRVAGMGSARTTRRGRYCLVEES